MQGRARWRAASVGALAGLILLLAAPVTEAAKNTDPCPGGLEPDLKAIVPHHLQIQNTGGREYLRLSNGIANIGAGPWHLSPQNVLADQGGTTTAIQGIWDKVGGPSDPTAKIVCSFATTQFQFHPEHNHWHIGNVALFDVRYGLDDGTGYRVGNVLVNDLGVSQSFKTTFCLIDWIKIDDNTKTPERTYWACDRDAPYQGVSVGWIDQYHHALEGQEVDITGAPPGVYYLTVAPNQERLFIESNYDNDNAWVSFRLSRDSSGNPKIDLISHSACAPVNMCGESLPNR